MPRWPVLVGCLSLGWRPVTAADGPVGLCAAPASSARASAVVVSGPFLDLALGRAFPRETDLRIAQRARGHDYTIHSLAWRDESFTPPVWYAARLGWRLRRPAWLAFALEFHHPKLYARVDQIRHVTGTRAGVAIDSTVTVGDLVQRFSISHGENYLALEALWVRRLGPLDAHLGTGFGPVIAHAENEVEGYPNRPRYEIAGLGWIGLAGVRLPWTCRVGFLAEYRFTRARLTVGIADGEARMTERTHHLSAGVTFRR